MFLLDLSGSSPSVVDRASSRMIAHSVVEFFHHLQKVADITPADASWCGMCMSYLIAFECVRFGIGLNITALSKRGDAVSFPFAEAVVLSAFQDGMRMGEEVLLQGRKDGEEQALRSLGKRLG